MLYWVFDLDYTLYNLSKQEPFDYNKLKEDVEVTNYLRKFPLYKCIFTNGTHGHAVKSLQRLNMNNIFHHIEARDTLNGLKPDIHIYQKFMEECGITEKDTVVFFEDTITNLKIAKTLGWSTVLITGYESAEFYNSKFKEEFTYVDFMFPDIKNALSYFYNKLELYSLSTKLKTKN